jgi:hypothetical protein
MERASAMILLVPTPTFCGHLARDDTPKICPLTPPSLTDRLPSIY